MAIQFLNTGYFPDNAKLTFGDATTPDLEIYHDGTDSYIAEVGTGDLIISGGNDIIFKDAVGNLLVNMNQSDRVELYFGGSKKFETYSTGAGVTGSLYFTSGNYIHFDNGVSNDYAIRKNSTTLEFKTGGTYVFNTGDVTFSGTITSGNITTNSRITFDYGGDHYLESGTDTFNFKNSGGTTTLQLNFSTHVATFTGNVDVNGTEITIGTNGSIFAENNIRFKSSGAAYIDHNTTSQSIKFRLSNSSSLDVTPLEITPSYLVAAGSIFVGADSTYDLGATATRWANIWVDNINGAAPRTGDYLPLAGVL